MCLCAYVHFGCVSVLTAVYLRLYEILINEIIIYELATHTWSNVLSNELSCQAHPYSSPEACVELQQYDFIRDGLNSLEKVRVSVPPLSPPTICQDGRKDLETGLKTK